MPLSTAGRRSHVDYGASSTLAGPVGDSSTLSFRRVVRQQDRVVVVLLAGTSLLTGGALVVRLLTADPAYGSGSDRVMARAVVLMVVAVELARLLQVTNLAIFAWVACDPLPMTAARGLRVAMLTTVVPDSEPLDVVRGTLEAMRRVRYAETVDVWILDEGDDARVRDLAERLDVHHFTRKGRPEYNRAAGPFRARTKAGNHNAWRAEHEADYDVVAQMDPDHVPLPCFLERTLGYFRDPDVAFVVAPQVYGNLAVGFVQHAAAAQSFVFTGVVQRGGNGMGAPLLIGTNHVYRTCAWHAIGGYQDSLIEDHLTGLTVTGTVNPSTGRTWKGVYTPDVLAIGEGPASWTDFFRQQRRWAYGVVDILLRHSPRLVPRLAPRQRLAYLLLQSFYPSCAVAWVLGNLATACYLAFGIPPPALQWWWAAVWACTFTTGLALLAGLRHYNVAAHERRELGVRGMIASLVAGPVYCAAGLAAVLSRPLTYSVTPKGALASSDSLRTFASHVLWATLIGAALAVALTAGQVPAVRAGWALFSLTACSWLPAVVVLRHVRGRRQDAGGS